MDKLQLFRKTREANVIFGIIYLAILYLLFSWALDTAATIAYLLSLVFLFLAISSFVNAFKISDKKVKPRH